MGGVPDRPTDRGHPWRLLLAAALVAAVAAACGAGGADTSTAQADPSMDDAPRSADGLPRPAVRSPLADPGDVVGPLPPPPRLVPLPTRAAAAATAADPPTTGAPAAAMAASVPVRLRIPTIGVDSELLALGLQPDGTLEVPPDGFPAGWYTGAPTPGELGPAILAGHVDWGGRPGVFFDLRALSPGDELSVDREDGHTASFVVTRVERFEKGRFPTADVYGDLDHAGLRLITCGGDFDRERRSYRDNLIVFAELVGTSETGR